VDNKIQKGMLYNLIVCLGFDMYQLDSL